MQQLMLHLGLSGWLLNYTGVCVYREKEEEDISFEKEKKRKGESRRAYLQQQQQQHLNLTCCPEAQLVLYIS